MTQNLSRCSTLTPAAMAPDQIELERICERLLPRAIEIATAAHAGQLDKGGHPYIGHPTRVMNKMGSFAAKVVAILHDVIEDGGVTSAMLLAEGFPPVIVEAIESVTRQVGEPYNAYIARAAKNPIGRLAKLGDLEDNEDLSRIASPSEVDVKRSEKYRRSKIKINKM